MNELASTTAVESPPGPPGTVPPQDPLRRIRRFGYGILGLQLAGFFIWSAVLYGHFALTWDFATYFQPWFLIAHGNLDPYSTLSGIPFWQNQMEFMPWILAPLYWVFQSSLTPLWLQDISIVVAELVAFTWICELCTRRCGKRDGTVLACAGLALLVANPWTWWSVSFDVHEEPLVLGFAALLVWDLSRGRGRAWIWMVLVLLGGAPSATYIIGIGLGAMLARRRIRTTGLAMATVAVAYSLVIVLVHGDVGVPLPRHYGYLATASGYVPPDITFSKLVEGIASHPLNIVRTLWVKREDVFAALAPGGLVGFFALPLMPFFVIVMLANALSRNILFIIPSFMSLPLYVLLPVGTVSVLLRILRRHRRIAIVLTGIIVAQALGWAMVWGPMISTYWLRVPGSTATTLAGIEARVHTSDEVYASQGIVGRFSGRTVVHALTVPKNFTVHGPSWFVLTPNAGTEILSPMATKALIGELAGPLDAKLVTHANGVWAFYWNPPPAMRSFSIPPGLPPLPAWTSAGAAGKPVLAGPESSWHVASTGAKGYVADQLEWLAPAARYVASVTLSTSGPVNVEVWNNTGDVLLARRTIPATAGIDTITMPVNAATPYQPTLYSGWGPFRARFITPPAGERIEVRVWSPGGTSVNIYSADLVQSPAGTA